ncbi:hypothetical protein BWI17_22215 [Betaproteobacteria bacterium GR16-43]|nr:hypothetical protein BWI17_22215 [Betaproteobacteria bacterium GR16-43]
MSTASPWEPPKARLAGDDAEDPLHAGFWRRFSAYWVDALLMYIISFTVTFGMIAMNPGLDRVATVFSIVLAWLYSALMVSSGTQATLGMMAFGIKVTDLEGGRITFLRATGRHFATWISAILLLGGFLMAAFTARKQALHDMIASTLVVRKDATPEEAASGSGTMKLTWGVWVMILLLGPMPMFAGIVAAISIPAYQDFTVRAHLVESVAEANAAKSAVVAYYGVNSKLPTTLDDTTFRKSVSPYAGVVTAVLEGPTIEIRVTPASDQNILKGGSVVMRSPNAAPRFDWTCRGDGIADRYLPFSCREPK